MVKSDRKLSWAKSSSVAIENDTHSGIDTQILCWQWEQSQAELRWVLFN